MIAYNLSLRPYFKGESSFSHHIDRNVGLSVIDRFTYFTLEFMVWRCRLTLSNPR
jgi:glycosylphosphatidylinositol transamidase (GPIT) subunit GPI8